ncbi:MAG: addiction module protein [Myxococcales bacterium]|nr:addiction module protein [Myxococcales bacterium]
MLRLMTYAAIEAEALNLSPAERERLVERLLSSIPAESASTWNSEWAVEAAFRHEELADGKVPRIPGSEVLDRARKLAPQL